MRSPTSPAARLKRLEAAEKRAKKLKRGAVLTAAPMAELLGVSWPILRGWCDDIPEMEKVFTRGGNGIEWEFKALQTVRALIKHFSAEQKKRSEKARKLRQAIGGDALDDLPEDMTIDEIVKAVRAAREVREEQQNQRALIKVSHVVSIIEKTFNRMLQAGIQAGREQDPTGQWPPEYAEKWQNAIDNLILEQNAAGEACLTEIRGGPA